MPAETTFHSPTSSDVEILIAFEKIADELRQPAGQCPVTVQVMQNHASPPKFPLSNIQSQLFAQHAKEHDGATWESVSIHFEPLKLKGIITKG